MRGGSGGALNSRKTGLPPSGGICFLIRKPRSHAKRLKVITFMRSVRAIHPHHDSLMSDEKPAPRPPAPMKRTSAVPIKKETVRVSLKADPQTPRSPAPPPPMTTSAAPPPSVGAAAVPPPPAPGAGAPTAGVSPTVSLKSPSAPVAPSGMPAPPPAIGAGPGAPPAPTPMPSTGVAPAPAPTTGSTPAPTIALRAPGAAAAPGAPGAAPAPAPTGGPATVPLTTTAPPATAPASPTMEPAQATVNLQSTQQLGSPASPTVQSEVMPGSLTAGAATFGGLVVDDEEEDNDTIPTVMSILAFVLSLVALAVALMTWVTNDVNTFSDLF